MEQQSEKVEGYRQTVSAALRQLGTDKSLGLPPEEITARLETHGSNALPSDQGVNWAQLILAQFTDIMVIILIVAALISALLGEEARQASAEPGGAHPPQHRLHRAGIYADVPGHGDPRWR